MDPKEIDSTIGQAWRAHYAGNSDAAIEQFARILAEVPDHIDANWGSALAFRKAGDREKALKGFRTVADLITKAAQTETENKERFFMLQRMVKQQIEQMADFI